MTEPEKYILKKLQSGDFKTAAQVILDPAVNYFRTVKQELDIKMEIEGGRKLTISPVAPRDPGVNDLWLKTR